MTGLELYQYFKLKSGYSYTGGLVTLTANSIFKDALISSLEKKYRELLDQKEYDEIRSIIKTDYAVNVLNNKIYLQSFYVSNITYTTPSGGISTVSVTTNIPHNLISGNSIIVAGVAGIATTTPTNAVNGTKTITKISDTSFSYPVTVATISGTYTTGTGTLSNGNASTHVTNNTISDYWHYLTLKAQFTINPYISFTTVNNGTADSPITIIFSDRNNIRTGEKLLFTGFGGTTIINGNYYIKKINQYKIGLYTDKNLQVPLIETGSYIPNSGIGTIKRVYNNYCIVQKSDQKISTFNIPTVKYPVVYLSDNMIKIEPKDEVVDSAMIDYISIPTGNLIIDVSNTTVNLEDYFPIKFLYFMADEARIIYSQKYRDSELYQEASIEQQKNR